MPGEFTMADGSVSAWYLCPDLGAYSTAVAAAEYGQQPQHAAELLSQIERLGLAAHSQQKVSCTTEADVEVSSS